MEKYYIIVEEHLASTHRLYICYFLCVIFHERNSSRQLIFWIHSPAIFWTIRQLLQWQCSKIMATVTASSQYKGRFSSWATLEHQQIQPKMSQPPLHSIQSLPTAGSPPPHWSWYSCFCHCRRKTIWEQSANSHKQTNQPTWQQYHFKVVALLLSCAFCFSSCVSSGLLWDQWNHQGLIQLRKLKGSLS